VAVPAGAHITFDTDFMAWAATTDERYDLIISNPPFSLALPFVQHALRLLAPGGTLVYLLRLSWFAGKVRYDGTVRGKQKYAPLHSVNPPIRAAVLVERPSFTGGGTDGEEYAFFAYQQANLRLTTQVDLLSWR
jgi:SAM-dependent methyltransferase